MPPQAPAIPEKMPVIINNAIGNFLVFGFCNSLFSAIVKLYHIIANACNKNRGNQRISFFSPLSSAPANSAVSIALTAATETPQGIPVISAIRPLKGGNTA